MWQWASMHITTTQKLRQPNGTQSSHHYTCGKMSPFASIVFKTCWWFHRYTALSKNRLIKDTQSCGVVAKKQQIVTSFFFFFLSEQGKSNAVISGFKMPRWSRASKTYNLRCYTSASNLKRLADNLKTVICLGQWLSVMSSIYHVYLAWLFKNNTWVQKKYFYLAPIFSIFK